MNGGMSAIGTKRTYRVALHMSALEGKADRDRKLFDSSEARSLSPANGGRRHGQLQLGPAPEEGLERALALNTGELVA